jgi:glutaredoxin
MPAPADASCMKPARGVPVLVALLLLLSTLLSIPAARADEAAAAPVTVHVFWRPGCPHCEAALDYLGRAAGERPWLATQAHNVFDDAQARDLFVQVAEQLGEQPLSVPLIVVGAYHQVGWLDARGGEVLAVIDACHRDGCVDRVLQALPAPGKDVPDNTPSSGAPANNAGARLPAQVELPLLGTVQTAQLSLPLLTVTLAAVDGFNPCAMWALVFLLGLLTGLGDRRRMWLLGIAFVATSAVVYFLFMTAWLQLVLFIGAAGWLRVVMGCIALAGGGWYLYEWKTRRDAACQVSSVPARRRLLDGLRAMAARQQLPLALAGIVLLAFAVNLVELACSAGIPAVYTQVLAMANLSTAAHYGYLALYVLVFLLDDLLVLAGALLTLQVTGLTGRYTHASTLIGGLLLVVLGLVLLLRPGWLGAG